MDVLDVFIAVSKMAFLNIDLIFKCNVLVTFSNDTMECSHDQEVTFFINKLDVTNVKKKKKNMQKYSFIA